MAIYVAAIDGMTTHDAADVTRLETFLLRQEGVVGVTANDLLVEAQGTPDMTVKVNPGSCFVQRDAAANNDNTLKFWHVIITTNTNVTIPAADASNPRIDLICVKVDTTATPDATASNVATLVNVQGTAAASPSAPATPSNHLLLATISVPALDTTISSGQITDSRVFIGLSLPYADGYRLKDTGANIDAQLYEDTTGAVILKSNRSGGQVKIDPLTNSVKVKGSTGGDETTIGGAATYQEFTNQASDPSTPASGKSRLYFDTTNKRPRYLDDAGTEIALDGLSELEFVIDGGGSAITTGQKGHLEVPFDCDVVGWTLLGDQSGSIVIDVWKDTYANFPPTGADTIAGSEKPTLSSVQKNQDLTLTTWTIPLTKGDVLAFNVDSITTVTRVVLALRVKKK